MTSAVGTWVEKEAFHWVSNPSYTSGYAQQLIDGMRESPLRGGLVALAAELARMAGWAYFDARQYSTARGYFTQALHLAQGHR